MTPVPDFHRASLPDTRLEAVSKLAEMKTNVTLILCSAPGDANEIRKQQRACLPWEPRGERALQIRVLRAEDPQGAVQTEPL